MNRPAIMAYHVIPAVFDAVVGPLLRVVAFSSMPTEPTVGNVFGSPRVKPAAS